LKFYENSFESLFLQATGEYYREEGNRLLAKFDCIQYMKKVIEIKIKEFYFSIYYFFSTDFIINR
jgi:hypothetical protein